MSEQDKRFERNIAIREGHKVHNETSYFTPRPQLDFENARHVFGEGFDRGYNAATAEANKRINELEGEVAELKEKLKFSEYAAAAESEFSDKLSDQVTELQANNNNLREELSDARHEVFELTISRNYEAAISKAVQLYHKMSTSPATPAESLAKHDAEVINKERNEIIEWIKSIYLNSEYPDMEQLIYELRNLEYK